MSKSARSKKRKSGSKKIESPPPPSEKEAPRDIRKNKALAALLAVIAVAAVCVTIYRAPAPMLIDHGLKSDSLQELQAATERVPYDPHPFYYLGIRWLQLGQPKPAVGALRRAADLDPDDEKSWMGAAIATSMAGEAQSGLGIALDYSGRHPNDANAHLTLALLCDQEGSVQEAYNEASLATRLAPSNATAWRLLGSEESRQGKMGDADKALRQAIAIDAQDWRAQLDLGKVLIEEKQPDAAIASFQAAARLAPGEALPTFHLGATLLELATSASQVEAARQELLLSAQIQPNNAGVKHQLGVCEMRLGDWKGARSDLEQAELFAPADKSIVSDLIAVDKKLSDPKALAGDTSRLSQLTEFEAKKQALLNQLNSDPSNPQPGLTLARLCAANHDDFEADQYYRIALAHDPNLAGVAAEAGVVHERASNEVPMPIISLEPTVLSSDDTPLPILVRDAEYLLAAGKADQAQTAYLSMLSRDSDCARAYVGLGQVMDAQNHKDQAIGYYEKAVSIDPKLPQAQFALAGADEALGVTDQAILHYQQGLALAPNDAEKWDALGEILARDDNYYDQAEAAYKKATVLEPRNAVFLRDLADLQANRNELGPAEANYRLSLSIAPKDALTQYSLAVFLITNRPNAASLKEAGSLLQSAALQASNPMITYWQGRLAVQQGDGKTAVADFLSALPHLYGTTAEDAWYNLSRAYTMTGNHAFADAAQRRSDRQRKLDIYIKAVQNQLRKTPQDLGLRLKLAQVYAMEGDADSATLQYEGVLRADPGNKSAQAGLKNLSKPQTDGA